MAIRRKIDSQITYHWKIDLNIRVSGFFNKMEVPEEWKQYPLAERILIV